MAKDEGKKKDKKSGKPGKDEVVEETKKSKKAAPDEKSSKKEKGSKSEASDSTIDDELDDPGEGGGWKIAEALGELLLIKPREVKTGIKSDYAEDGKTDAILADVYIINEKKPAKSEPHEGTLIFQGFLQGALRDKIGKWVVGRLVKGEATKGKSAPYLLEAADADEKAKASEYLRSR